MRSRNDSMRKRIRWQACLLIVFFGYLLFVLYRVQIKNHDIYLAEARKKYVTSETIKGSRGEIYDFNGNLLVSNMPRQHVFITPCNIKSADDERLARIFERELKVNYDTALAKIARKQRTHTSDDGTTSTVAVQYAQIATNMTLEDTRRLREVLKKEKLGRNVHYENVFVRFYPRGKFLSNVLGVTTLNEGTMGVEKRFEETLRSDSGSRTYMRTLDGWQLGDQPLELQNSHDGSNIYLTVVEPLQAIVEEELDRAVEQWKPQAAYAIMVDPSTGNVLAIAERPSFDPNDRKTLTGSAFRMRLMSDFFEPGSIMKPLTVAGALDYGVIAPDTRIDCGNGTWYYRGKPLTDTHGYGMQDVTGVLRKSSNIGTAKIALLMGEQRLYRTLCKFGLGRKSGLPLTPESLGLLHPVNKWDGLMVTRVCIGYAVCCTPVQMVRAYCALANRGNLPKLRLIDRMVNPETGEVTPYPTQPMQRIYSESVGEQVVNMMVAVTEKGGTATKAAIPGYHVAGKTGTSHKNAGGGYVNKYYASFVGFVPAEKPAFVLLVTVDEPRGGKFGGTVSAPVWKAIAERALKYLNVEPTVPLEK